MRRSKIERNAAAGEVNLSSAEAAHQRAKLAFERSCQGLNEEFGAEGIENAWHNLDNWWDSPGYSGGLYGGHKTAEEQNAAVAKINKSFRKLHATFNKLDEEAQSRLFEMTASFTTDTKEGSSGFEFNLAQIMQGEQADQRLGAFQFDGEPWDPETQQAYGRAKWEYETWYQNSIVAAAEFIFGEENRISVKNRHEPANEREAAVWQRMDEVGRGLGDIFLAALSNGHQEAVLSAYRWLHNFSVSLLNSTLQPLEGRYTIDDMRSASQPNPHKYWFQFACFFLCRHLADWSNNTQERMSYRNSMWG